MLPIANLHLKDLYETTVEFFTLRSPTFSFRTFTSDDLDSAGSDLSIPITPRDRSPASDSVAIPRTSSSLRVKPGAAKRVHCPSTCSCRALATPSAAASTLYNMRRENDAKWEERCKLLEKTLKETKELLRIRELEIDALKQEKEKLIIDRGSRERGSSRLDRRRSHDIGHHRSNSSHSLLSQCIRPSSDWTEQRDIAPASQTGGTRPRASSDAIIETISTVSEEERAHGKSMEIFLTKTDLWSGAQVIQAVQDLNSEILQFAASAVELCTFVSQRPPKMAQTVNEVTSRLGSSLTRILSTRDHSQDPMLVQLALQGCLAFCISRALSSFCIGFQSRANTTLTQIHNHMFQFGEQHQCSFSSVLKRSSYSRATTDVVAMASPGTQTYTRAPSGTRKLCHQRNDRNNFALDT